MVALQVIAVCLAAVTMALALAHALEFPGKMRLSRENYLATQTIYYPGFSIGGAAEPAAILAILFLLLMTPRRNPAFGWTLVSLVAAVAAHLVYWLVTHPVNRFWTGGVAHGSAERFFAFGLVHRLDRSPDEWERLRDRWERSHIARAVLAMVSFVTLAVAIAVYWKGVTVVC